MSLGEVKGSNLRFDRKQAVPGLDLPTGKNRKTPIPRLFRRPGTTNKNLNRLAESDSSRPTSLIPVTKEEREARARAVLREARKLLRQYGWSRSGGKGIGLHEAIRVAGRGDVDASWALDLVRARVGTSNVPAWNDDPLRDVREVKLVLDLCCGKKARIGGWMVGE